jgi:hypothetical protein
MFILCTPNCTVTVSILFSSETSEKYKKAREWDIICTNARWISDIMTGESYIKNCRAYRDPRQRIKLCVSCINYTIANYAFSVTMCYCDNLYFRWV